MHHKKMPPGTYHSPVVLSTINNVCMYMLFKNIGVLGDTRKNLHIKPTNEN